MKKLLLILLMGFVVTASKAQKCNFSGVKLEKSGQQGQDWYFQTNMGPIVVGGITLKFTITKRVIPLSLKIWEAIPV